MWRALAAAVLVIGCGKSETPTGTGTGSALRTPGAESPSVAPAAAIAKPITITVGNLICTTHADASVWCWQPDHRVQNPIPQPREMPTLTGSTDLSAETNFGTCGLRGGQAYCIRSRRDLQARDVCGIAGATAVRTGQQGACALLSTGGVRCWGKADAFYAPCDATTARDVPGIASAASLFVGAFDGCVITREGDVRCWKLDDLVSDTPAAAPQVTTVAAMTGSTWLVPEWDLCGVRDTRVDCVHPHTKEVSTFTLPARVTKLVRGMNDRCALLATGHVYCWHRDGGTPAPLAAFDGIVDIATDGRYLCTVDASGGVMCTGAGAYNTKVTDPPASFRYARD